MNIIQEFSERLLSAPPAVQASPPHEQAAVAMIIRFSPSNLEILLIERAHHDQDPWSGHLALPGGRRESADQSLQGTAVREVMEETGIALDPSDYLGRLSDVRGGHFPLVIACFVYKCPRSLKINLDPLEVADAFWVPLAKLESNQESVIEHETKGGKRQFHGIRIPGRQQPLWGITLGFVRQIRGLLIFE